MFTLKIDDHAQLTLTDEQATVVCGEDAVIENSSMIGLVWTVAIRTEHNFFKLVTTNRDSYLNLLHDLQPEPDPASYSFM
jgi:hypothetical protein